MDICLFLLKKSFFYDILTLLNIGVTNERKKEI